MWKISFIPVTCLKEIEVKIDMVLVVIIGLEAQIASKPSAWDEA